MLTRKKPCDQGFPLENKLVMLQNSGDVPGAPSRTDDMSSVSAHAGDTLPTLCLKDLEALAIKEALACSDGNVAAAADLLGLGKATLYRKLKNDNSDTNCC